VEATLNSLAKKLSDQGFSPNQLTLTGLALTFLAGCIYATGAIFLGGILLIAASLADLLDGPLARVSKKESKFGAFLDSTVDRYSDFFIFGGLALFFARENQGSWLLLVLGIILGSYITSYTKARAENFIEKAGVGVFGRAERIIILCLGSLLWPLFDLALWILLIGTHVTAIHRILHAKKIMCALDTQEESPPAEPEPVIEKD